MDDLRTVIPEFVAECQEKLEQIDADLALLATGGAGQESLTRIFRALHTLKGNCGFFGFVKFEQLIHAGESLVSKLTERRLVSANYGPYAVELLFELSDG